MSTSLVASPSDPKRDLMVQWALWYARCGWALVPLWWTNSDACACGNPGCDRPGEHPIAPLLLRGLVDASRDERTIVSWWDAYPRAGIGIVTGSVSRLVVLVVDPTSGGTESIRSIEAQREALPPTITVEAVAGSRELWFTIDNGRPIEGLGDRPGLHLRAEGTFVLAPPSEGPGGTPRKWAAGRGPEEIVPASAPAWLLGTSAPNTRRGPQSPVQSSGGEPTDRPATGADDLGGVLEPLEALDPDPEIGAVEQVLERIASKLGGAGNLRRETVIAAVADKLQSLGVTASGRLARAALSSRSAKRADADLPGQPITFRTDAAATNPVDGAELLTEIAAVFRRFLVLPEHADTALALWTTFTYALDHVPTSPRLWIHSPTKICGKSRLLTVLEAVCQRPLMTSCVTSSAVFRVIPSHAPTLLIDEFDNAQVADRAELRAILNSGHTRSGAWVVKTAGENYEPRRFSSWAAIAFAGISLTSVPDTLASRSIRIEMRRKLPGELVERLVQATLPSAMQSLRSRIIRWIADRGAELRASDPPRMLELGDREADNWGPLLAIATLAGGAWPQQATAAAIALSGAQREVDTGVLSQLLGDIRDLFLSCGTDRLATVVLVSGLVHREDRPWGTWRHGRELNANGLAKLLKEFGIAPKSIRLPDGTTPKGYLSADFEDAFRRYLPPAAAMPPASAAGGPGVESPPVFGQSAPAPGDRRILVSRRGPDVPFPPGPFPTPGDAA